jgi:hypothetical protein
MSAVFIQAAEVCLITQTVGEIVPKRNFKGHSCMQVGDISSLAIRIKTLMYRNCPSEQALPNGVRSWKVCLSSFVVFFSLGLLSLLFAAFQNWKVSGISGILHQNLQFGLFLRHTYSILELKCGLYTILFTACFSWKLDTHLYSAMCSTGWNVLQTFDPGRYDYRSTPWHTLKIQDLDLALPQFTCFWLLTFVHNMCIRVYIELIKRKREISMCMLFATFRKMKSVICIVSAKVRNQHLWVVHFWKFRISISHCYCKCLCMAFCSWTCHAAGCGIRFWLLIVLTGVGCKLS